MATVPGRLFHLLTTDELRAARGAGRIDPTPEGFVHLCTGAQAAGVVDRWFGDSEPSTLVVLELESDRLSDVRWEESEPGERFPHLYAPLELDTVTSILTWSDALAPELERHS